MRLTLAVFDAVFLITAFGVRTMVQLRRVGDAGWRMGRPRSFSEAAARMAMFGSGALAAASLAMPSTSTGARAIGVVACAIAIALVFVAQLQMGSSWRIGVDPDERTDLVTTGLYTWIRNPIYTGMVLFVAGHAVARPNVAGTLALAAMAIGVEAQVRAVEEPYLARVHGAAFTTWATRSGRFLPRVG